MSPRKEGNSFVRPSQHPPRRRQEQQDQTHPVEGRTALPASGMASTAGSVVVAPRSERADPGLPYSPLRAGARPGVPGGSPDQHSGRLQSCARGPPWPQRQRLAHSGRRRAVQLPPISASKRPRSDHHARRAAAGRSYSKPMIRGSGAIEVEGAPARESFSAPSGRCARVPLRSQMVRRGEIGVNDLARRQVVPSHRWPGS